MFRGFKSFIEVMIIDALNFVANSMFLGTRTVAMLVMQLIAVCIGWHGRKDCGHKAAQLSLNHLLDLLREE